MPDSLRPPRIIAHRGASGYLPEHTLEAKAFAYAAGADYLEQDVVLTRDDVPIVIHDRTLDTVTDVRQRFPDRARKDGRNYAIDFTWAELQTLTVHERTDLKTGRAVYPLRYPLAKARFRLHTLAEEIEFIHGLNHSTGRTVGIYPEIKSPAFHHAEGKDISAIVLQVLRDYGYRSREDECFLQCFNAAELQRIHQELHCELRLVQLIGDPSWKEHESDYVRLLTSEGLTEVAQYADGVGPTIEAIVNGDAQQPAVTSLVRDAHAVGLEVHPFTLRVDDLPRFAGDHDEASRLLFDVAGIDGLFTDFPDRLKSYLQRHA
ncbi:MAG: glycerophosphodiester phosphodiesterase [Planctomycetaceae bacterium]|nr:glycerophosphodiester phosphodiesterase [Planctomycetaceae bacterium]